MVVWCVLLDTGPELFFPFSIMRLKTKAKVQPNQQMLPRQKLLLDPCLPLAIPTFNLWLLIFLTDQSGRV